MPDLLAVAFDVVDEFMLRSVFLFLAHQGFLDVASDVIAHEFVEGVQSGKDLDASAPVQEGGFDYPQVVCVVVEEGRFYGWGFWEDFFELSAGWLTLELKNRRLSFVLAYCTSPSV